MRLSLARCQTAALADAADVGVDGNVLRAEGKMRDEVGTFSANAVKFEQLIPCLRHNAVILRQKLLAESTDIARLHIVKPGRFNRGGDLFVGQFQHALGRPREFKQSFRRCGCIAIQRLRREHARNTGPKGRRGPLWAACGAAISGHDVGEDANGGVDIGERHGGDGGGDHGLDTGQRSDWA